MADPPVKPIRVLDLAGLAELQPPDWLVDGILPARAAAMLCGNFATAKTFAALDLGLTVASGGGTWFGRPTKGGRVLYLAAEAAFSLQRRVGAWRQVNRE